MIAESIDTEAESGRFINRELSWLEFNSRVLAQAEDSSVPLLERGQVLRHLVLQSG